MRFFWVRLGWVAAAAALLTAAPSAMAAAPRAGDVRATRSFISIGERFFERSIAGEPGVRRSLTGYVDHVSAGCAESLTGLGTHTGSNTSLANQAALAVEAQLDYAIVFMRALPFRRAAHALASLHWSRRSLDRTVGAYAKSGLAILTLHATDVCADIKASAATGFTSLPVATQALIASFPENDSAATWTSLLAKMHGYETSGMRSSIARFTVLAKRDQRLVQKDYNQQFNRLGDVLLGPGAVGG